MRQFFGVSVSYLLLLFLHSLIVQVTAPSFYSMISNDEDTLKIVVQVMNGMSASATELQKYLSYWDKYKYIWENDKVCYRDDDKLYHASHPRP